MNVFLAYLLDEYESAGKKAESYHSAILKCYTYGHPRTAERLSVYGNVSHVRRACFYDAIQNFLDLTGGLDPDDVAAAEKVLADF